MAVDSRCSVTDHDPEIRAARAFAEQDLCGYIQNFVKAAKCLENQAEAAMGDSALICLLVFLYRHVVGLRLKYLTISAAQHLQKPLTHRHVGVINAFTFQQLWSNLTLMLDQIMVNAEVESPLALSTLEADVRYVEDCDLGLHALRALALRPNGHSSNVALDQKSPEVSPFSIIARFESLSDSLLRIEDWVTTLRPLQPR